jgi:acylphosphatase
MQNNVRAHVIISGRVQGVFFRVETKSAADRYGVMGWVKNQRDGTVAATFEGTKETVDSVLEWCNHGPPYASVQHVDVKWEDYKGEFNRFDIRY